MLEVPRIRSSIHPRRYRHQQMEELRCLPKEELSERALDFGRWIGVTKVDPPQLTRSEQLRLRAQGVVGLNRIHEILGETP